MRGNNNCRNFTTMLEDIRGKGKESITHSKRVERICRRFAVEIGLDGLELEDLLLGAQLHDIGKIFIDDEILYKTTALIDEDRQVLATHPGRGAEYALDLGANNAVLEVILNHHERWDGLGYPDGLAGAAIPLYARIVALADTFDVITSTRSYDPPRGVKLAVEEIERHAGAQFDPELAEHFLRFLRDKHRRVLELAEKAARAA